MERVPGLLNVDHVAITVPDVEAATVYCSTFGAVELYRLGPFDARDAARSRRRKGLDGGAPQRGQRTAAHCHAANCPQPHAGVVPVRPPRR